MYSEKATTVCETSIVDLSFLVPVKSMLEIFQNHVAFSEFMNFNPNPTRGTDSAPPHRSYCIHGCYFYVFSKYGAQSPQYAIVQYNT